MTDTDDFVTSIMTSTIAAKDTLLIRINNLSNIGYVRPLSASFEIFITDSSGGQIAYGTSSMLDRELL